MLPRNLFFTGFASLAALAAVASAALAQTPDGDWATYNRTLRGDRYSPLKEISAANVRQLRPVATFDIGEPLNFQTGPVVIDGTMYLTTYKNTYAIDAATGRLKWKAPGPSQKTGNVTNRGVAYAAGRLFRGGSDGAVYALDAASGHTLWHTQIADITGGETIPMAPIVWHDMVFVGNAGGDNFGVTGRIYALDAATGKQRWRFDTVPKTGPAAATWLRKSAANPPTGGTSWTTYSLDPDSGVLYTGTGNVAPDFAEALHPGENLYATCVLALNARTGRLIAFTQATKHDFHDWDVAAAPALITTRAGRHLAATGGKDGLLHGIDVTAVDRAATHPGRMASGNVELYGSVGRDAMKTLYLTPVTRRFNTRAPFSTQRYTRFAPGSQGGVEWNGPAYYAPRNLIVVPAIDWPVSVKLVPDAKRPKGVRGKPWTGAHDGMFGATDPKSQWGGYLTALDADSGAVRWKYRAATPMVGAVTTTGGGLVFAGDLNGDMRAFDVRTGRILWTHHTGRPIGGGVVSYAVGRRQYVAEVEGIYEGIWKTKPSTGRIVIYRRP